MESIATIFGALNSASPLAVIALLAYVIFMMTRAKTEMTSHVNTIKTNDLHELPTMASDIRNIAESLQRIEVKQGEEFSYLRARLNGHGK